MTETGHKLFSVSNASDRAEGLFVSPGNTDPDILSVSIDSRTVSAGVLFIALIGEVTDGHNYISQAARSGASSVMVSSKYYADNVAYLTGSEFNCCLIVVENTLSGFHKLAASWVSDFENLIKVAVTGSNGKSTTKELIGAILAEDGDTIINEGNLNSETGLPLSVLNIKKEHKYGVFEMGINHPEEMKALVSVFSPQYALVTNIGTAHLGLMGSQEAIAAEKSDIFSLFDKSNIGFIPAEDSWAEYLEDRCPGNTVRYGFNSTEGVDRVSSLGLKGWNIQYKNLEINFKLVGQHNLNNAIASISLSSVLGISPCKIKKGLEKIEPLKGRSQVVEGIYTVIEDSYNANPESMEEIFNFISDLEWAGRVLLVLGTMKELGRESEKMHRVVGSMVVKLDPDLIFFYGSEMRDAYNTVLDSDFSGRVIHNLDYQELENLVLDSLIEGDLILLKGSRSMELNRLADKISKSREVLGV
ncbi:MAG: UDP-N-acetylmuramoyl-tripeptide--D-alanyl-D-alanine ligase [Spirochaetia bacterium]|jgi:UDP-N-acetylmuramoyl-tripeptide--D-alanyl-D-alanine ligase|nr:UDP-N-acetylmuramoyl-tripeptide--D-alanyl-D-alanine ligase [Spirochaetia bacterium]